MISSSLSSVGRDCEKHLTQLGTFFTFWDSDYSVGSFIAPLLLSNGCGKQGLL